MARSSNSEKTHEWLLITEKKSVSIDFFFLVKGLPSSIAYISSLFQKSNDIKDTVVQSNKKESERENTPFILITKLYQKIHKKKKGGGIQLEIISSYNLC